MIKMDGLTQRVTATKCTQWYMFVDPVSVVLGEYLLCNEMIEFEGLTRRVTGKKVYTLV